MADLLTHVLVAYCVFTVASWRLDWLADRWVAVGMGGAILPDLVKLDLLLDPGQIEAVVGFPVTHAHFATLGGVLVTAGLVTILFERRWWRYTYSLLVAGGTISLLVDGLRFRVDGHASAWLFPFLPTSRPPTPNLYVSSDLRVLLVTFAFFVVVLGVDRYRTLQP
jgi:hypothetical protein